MTYILELKYHATVSTYKFSNKAAADAVVEELTPKLGKHFLGRNEKDQATHKFTYDEGEAVVVCEKIESVAVMDLDLLLASKKIENDIHDQEVIRRKLVMRAALKDHSVSGPSS